MLIYSKPTGAKVTINHHTYGKTPDDGMTPLVVTSNWYWHYLVEVEKEGYQKHMSDVEIKAKWWAKFPLDIFVEVLPFPVYDEHVRYFTLDPLPPNPALLPKIER
jgi:hypothetical protein